MLLFSQKDFINNPFPMRIAVAGGGFCGLSTAYFLARLGHALTLFEPIPVAMRASSLAQLLHPFIHPQAKCSYRGYEAHEAALKLIEGVCCEKAYIKRPHLKLANHLPFVEPIYEACTHHEDLLWQDETSYGASGALVLNSVQVDCTMYLSNLEDACRGLDVQFQASKLGPELYEDYDLVVLASGASMHELVPFKKQALSYLKGQLFELDNETLKVSQAISAYRCHIIPSIDGKTLTLGSTYERNFEDDKPNLEQAYALLKEPSAVFNLPFDKASIKRVRSGVRLNAPNRLPFMGQLNEKVWVFSAMSSKGLLYHALLAQELSMAIHKNDMNEIDSKFWFNTSLLSEQSLVV